MMHTGDIQYKRVSNTVENIIECAELLNLAFGNGIFTVEYITWLYKQNPNGEAVGFNAYSGKKLVGHYVTIPVLYVYNGIETKGLLSLNTATHPKFQGLGIFTNLASKTYDLAKEMGYKFVVGVANQNSTHGFLKKLGFHLIGPLDAYINVIPIKQNHQEFDFYSTRIESSLKWRLSKPNAEYYNRSSSVVSNTHLKWLYVIMCNNGGSMLPKIAYKSILISLGINNKPKAILNIKIPKIFKPSPLNFIILSLQNDFLIPHRDRLFFENIDFDAY